MHAAQQRKGTHIPYVSHLLGTCAITFEYGGDEDEAIAALLHDAIEDIRPTAAARETVEAFGPRVLAIVEGCTDSDRHPKPPWRERKEAFLARLAEADRSVLLVASADKLHNARTLLADVRRIGDDVWKRFKADRESSLWYYQTAVEVIRGNPEHHPALVDELERTVRELSVTTQGSSSEPAATGASDPS
jgi:(p)ppGpp synthase/HD superfamily hydrolase